MKRLAWRLLSGCLLAALAACTGYYRAIVTRNYRRAFGYLAPGAIGPDGRKLTLSSFLHRARYGPYHAHLRMAPTRHGWAISSIDRI